MDLLPPVGECRESLGLDTTDAGESGMEMTGGSPPADSDISADSDMLQTVLSVMTQMSDKCLEIDTPDTMESGMEVAVDVLRLKLALANFRMCYRQLDP